MKNFTLFRNEQVFIKIALLSFLFLNVLFVSGQNCSVNAGISSELCSNERLFLDGSFTEPVQPGIDVVWTQVGGASATIVDPTNLKTEVTDLIAGETYVFRIYTTCADGALTYQDVTHTVLPVSDAYAGPDLPAACPGSGFTLSANSPGANETGLWTGGGGAVIIDNPSDPNSTITLSENGGGTVTLRWTITNSNGCSSYDEMTLTNFGGAEPVFAGPDQMLDSCYSSTRSTSMSASYGGSGLGGQQGTWEQISGPSVAIISSIHSNTTGVSNLIGGEYVFRWTVEGPCANGYDEVTIDVANATSDVTNATIISGSQRLCDVTVTSTTLEANKPLYAEETGTWELVSPVDSAVTIENPNSPVTVVSGLESPNSYVFRYTITNQVTNCTSSASTSVSYFTDAPTLEITTTDPIVLPCGVSQGTFDFIAGGSGTTSYRIISGPGGGYPSSWLTATSSSAGTHSQTVGGLTAIGRYEIEMQRVTNTGAAVACGSVYDNISIVTSQETEQANAGTDQMLDCNVQSTSLIANIPAVGEGTWTQVDGPITIFLSDPHSPELDITGLSAEGEYTFRWVISGGPFCEPTQDDVVVRTSSNTPIAVNAGIDQSVCVNTPVYLDAEEPTYVFEVGTWTVTPSEGVIISDFNDPKAIVTGLSANTNYTFSWTIRNGCGAADASTVNISVTNEQGPEVAEAGTDQCYPSGTTTVTLDGNNPTQGAGTWYWVSGPNTPSITTPIQYNTEVTGIVDGTYEFEWVIESGGCIPTRDTVIITIDQSIESFDAGADQQICGNTATISSSLGREPLIGTGTWSQVYGNHVEIVSPNSYTTQLNNLVEGAYKFRYTIVNGGCEEFSDVVISISEPGDIANIAEDTIGLCGTFSLDLDADDITAGTGVWSLLDGPGTPSFSSSNDPNATVSGLITGSYRFVWTVKGGAFCGSTSDTLVVNVVQAANAGADQSYCDEVSGVSLVGTVATAGTWTQIGEDPSLANLVNNPSGNTAIATELVPGTYTFEYTVSTEGCSSSDQMQVTLYEPPTVADAGPNQTLCDFSTFQLNANTAQSGTGTWKIQSRPAGDVGDFVDASDPATIYTPTPGIYGVYVFEWEIANGDCSESDQVIITNFQEPSDANAGPDQATVCGTSVTMAATAPDAGLGTWSIAGPVPSGSTPFIVSPTNPNSIIDNLIPDSYPANYTFVWTVSNGAVCQPKTDTVIVEVYEPAIVADAGEDQDLCNETTSFTLSGNDVSPSTGVWELYSTNAVSNPTFDQNDNAPEVTDIENAEYVFVWKATSTMGCVTTDTITVTNFAQPLADAGDDISLCQYQPLALNADIPSEGIGTWAVVSVPSGAINPKIKDKNSPTSLVLGIVAGTYEFSWTVNNGNCSATDNVLVTIEAIPTQANAGADISVCPPDDSAVLAGNEPTSGTGTWTLESQPSGSNPTFTPEQYNTSVSDLIAGEYVFYWTIANGACSSVDSMKIVMHEPVTVAATESDREECNESSISISGNTPVNSGEAVSWTLVSGPNSPSISNSTSETATVTGMIPGVYVFRYTISSVYCPSTTDVLTITNYPAANAGADQVGISTCGLTSVTLNANNPYPGIGEWSITSGTGGSFDNNTQRNTVFSGIAGNAYTLRWTVNSGATCETFDEMQVTFNEEPTVDAVTNINECAETSVSVSFSGTLPTSTDVENIEYHWTNNNTSIGLASSGIGNIASFSLTNNGISVQTATINVTPHYTNSGTGAECVGTTNSFTITVQPTPLVTSAATKTICNGDGVDYNITSGVSGTTFTWSRAAVTGITETAVSGQTSDPISESLTNTTNSPVDVEYIITPTGPTGCDGPDFTFSVTVQPTPNVIPTNNNSYVCHAGYTDIDLSTTITGATVTYSWTAVVISGSATLDNNSGSGNTISERLRNTSNAEAVVQYTITPHIGSCDGTAQTVDVTVNPQATANAISNQTVCNGSPTSDIVFGTPITDGTVTYTWANNNTDINLGATSGGNATGISSFNAVNTVTSQINGLITVTPSYTNTAGGSSCSGVNRTFRIYVNPTAQVNNPGDLVACPGDAVAVNFSTNNTDGVTTYAWTSDNTAVGSSASDNGNMSFTASNSTTAPISANITVTPTYTNGGVSCSGPAETFTITVNPVGQVNPIADQEICSGDLSAVVTFSTQNTGGTTNYSWTIDHPEIGLTDGSGVEIPAFTAVNYGTDPIVATIIVTPTFENGGESCTGSSETFTITVNPDPVVSSISEITICSGEAVDYTIESATAGVTYAWTASNTVGTVNGYTASGTTTNISDVLTNASNADGSVVYTIIPTGPAPTSCVGPAFKLQVNVVNCNPKIGVAKQLVSVDYNPDGSADVLFNIRVQNYGNLQLEDIRVTEDLNNAFGNGNYEVLGLSSTSFDVNTAFNGSSTLNLLNNSGTTNKLAVGASTDIRLLVKVLTPGSYNNQVTATSTTGNVSDDSQNGSDPDPDGDEEPGNNNVVTPVVIGSCSLTANVTQNSTCGNAAGEVTLTASGTGSITLNGVEKASPASYLNLPAGYYEASYIDDVTGCVASTNFEITNSNSDLTAQVTSHTDVSCNGGSNGIVTVSPYGGAAPYSYTLNGVVELDGVFAGLTAGEYSARISDGNGCSYTVSFDIDEPEALYAEIVGSEDVSCHEGSNGSAIVNVSGGSTPYSYLWNDGSAQTTAEATGLTAGSYNVTITDGNGCSTTASVTIGEPTEALTISAHSETDPGCYGSNDGRIGITVIGGTAPYRFVWNNGQAVEDAVNLVAGTYSVSVVDANGCSTSGTYSLSDPAEVSITVGTIVNTECNALVGSVVLTSSDDSDITLNGVTQASGTTFSGLAAGYHVAVSNGSCPASVGFNIINENSDLAATVSVADPLCNGGVVTATVTTTGGTGSYTYVLNGSVSNTDGIFTGLGSGVYNVLVSDGNGCSYTVSFDIDEPEVLGIILVDKIDPNCDNSGEIIVSGVGGTTPYTYAIVSGTGVVSTNAITELVAGDYTIEVTDGNDCSALLNVTMEEEDKTAPTFSCPKTQVITADANCQGTLPDLTALVTDAVDNCSASTTITQSVPEGTILNSDILVTIKVADAAGNESECEVLVQIDYPERPIVSAGDNGEICATTSTYTLNGSAVDADSIVWSTSGTGTFDDVNALDAVYTPSLADKLDGQVQLTLTAFGSGKCGSASDQMVLTIWQAATAYAGRDAAVAPAESYQVLDAAISNSESFSWTLVGDGTILDADKLSPVFIPEANQVGSVDLVLAVQPYGDICDEVRDTMTIIIGEAPSMFFEKRTTGLTFNPNGTTNVIYEISLENTGNVDLSNISIKDDLADAFPGSCSYSVRAISSANFVLNFNFDGDSDTELLSSGNKLAPNEKRTVVIDVVVANCDPNVRTYENTAVAIAESPGGEVLNASDAAVIQIGSDPVLGLSKDLVSINLNSDGSYDALFIFRITNYGDVELTNVAIEDDLNVAFEPGNFEVEEIYSEDLVVNTDFNGDTDINLLAENNLLRLNESGAVVLRVKILDAGTYTNTATAIANNPTGELITDVSHDGSDPAPGGGNNPDDFDDPTEIIASDCLVQVGCPSPSSYNFNSQPGLCGYQINNSSLDATGAGDCGPIEVTHDYGAWGNPYSLRGATFPVGTTVVTWTATDAVGNTSSCQISITVEDKESPEFLNCPENEIFTVGLFPNACEGGAIWSIPVAQDNCSEVTVTQISGPEQGEVLPVGTHKITYLAEDASGNSSTCSFSIKVIDTEVPVVVCQPDITVDADLGSCSWTSPANTLSPLLANSNCPSVVGWRVVNPDGSEERGVDDVSGYEFDLGVSTVYYTITENASGQNWDCSFRVTVEDAEAPVIECMPTVNVLAEPGQCSAIVSLTAPAATDNCLGDLNYSFRVFNPDNSIGEIISSGDFDFEFQNGISRIEWSVSDAFGNESNCWQNVWVTTDIDALKPNAGKNAEICETDVYSTNAFAPDYTNVVWTTSGTGTFEDANAVNTRYFPSKNDLNDGIVVLTITSFIDCASTSDQMLLRFSKTPVLSAGEDASICENENYQLVGGVLTSSASVEWTSLGDGTFSNSEILNPVYTPGTADIEAGFVELVITGISGTSCNNGTDTMILSIDRLPIVFAGEDAWICQGENYTLENASVENGTSVKWLSSGTGTFDDETTVNATYIPSESDISDGSVVLTLTHLSNGKCDEVKDVLVLNISHTPSADAGDDRIACYGEELQINANASSYETLLWTTDGAGVIENAETLNPTYVPGVDETGIVTMTLSITGQTGCSDKEEVIDRMEIEIMPPLIIDIGEDETIHSITRADLSGEIFNGSGAYFYTWSPADFVLDANSKQTETMELNGTTIFELLVIDANTGCSGSDTKTITVSDNAKSVVSFYTGFSPNNDGVNDTWAIKGIENFPLNEVLIFNRWGDKVKELYNYNNTTVVWDGTNNKGEDLPDGTYYYVVKLTNVDEFTGWVQIRKGR